MFLHLKHIYSGNKTLNQYLGANSKKHIFCNILLQFSCFFFLFLAFQREKHILTRNWSMQHPNTWQNMKHPTQKTCRSTYRVSCHRAWYSRTTTKFAFDIRNLVLALLINFSHVLLQLPNNI